MRLLASAKDVKGGIAGAVGKEPRLFDDMPRQLSDEVHAWREAGYPGDSRSVPSGGNI